MADKSANSGNASLEADASIAEPPYKKNLERLASLQDRLSKVQKTAESLLATVSGTGDYTDKLVYTDVDRVKSYLTSGVQLTPGLSLDDDNAVEVRFVIKCSDSNQQQDLLSKLKLTSELKEN